MKKILLLLLIIFTMSGLKPKKLPSRKPPPIKKF